MYMLSARLYATLRASMVRGLFLVPVLALAIAVPVQADLAWDTALQGEHRSEKNAARDPYRHPRETLEFFGLREDMTVVELSPGGGWYTEVLAPLLASSGNYYAAHYSVNGGSYARRALGRR